jgi:2'-5' RNA ligase
MPLSEAGRQLTGSQDAIIRSTIHLDESITAVADAFSTLQDTQTEEGNEDLAVPLRNAHQLLTDMRGALPQYVDGVNAYKRNLDIDDDRAVSPAALSTLARAVPSGKLLEAQSGQKAENSVDKPEEGLIKKPPLNAFQFREVYAELGIDLSNLGCVMLDIEPIVVSDVIAPEHIYYAKDPVRLPYVTGIVSEGRPHVTLLFGLLQNAHKIKRHVDTVLSGWSLEEVIIKDVDYFVSPHEGEPYYTLIAHLERTPQLLEGNDRMRMLPHVNTFPEYLPHITLAFIKQDQALLERYLKVFNQRLAGKRFGVQGLNYGHTKGN